jgi:hypothetical protein
MMDKIRKRFKLVDQIISFNLEGPNKWDHDEQ